MNNEIWVDVPDYEDFYQVSNFGKVKSKDKIITINRKNRQYKRKRYGRLLKFYKNNAGYFSVELSKENQSKKFLVHRLIMISFFGKSDLEVNHINGDKKDNSLKNLEWSTRSDNQNHAYSSGLRKVTFSKQKINEIISEHLSNDVSVRSLAKKHNISYSYLKNIIRGLKK